MPAQTWVAEFPAADRDDGDDYRVQRYVRGLAIGRLDFGGGFDAWCGVGFWEDRDEDICVRSRFFLAL